MPAANLFRGLTLVLAMGLLSAPATTSAQDVDFGEGDGAGLGFEHISTVEGTTGTVWERYVFVFEPTAAIPEYPYPEAMVVKVMSGSFAFRVGDEDDVIIDPQGREIPILEPSGDAVYVTDVVVGEVEDSEGACTTLCIAPPGDTVLIEEGATVYLPGYVSCFFCNFVGFEAQLMVIAETDGGSAFSWTTLVDDYATAPRSRQTFSAAVPPGMVVGCR